MKTGAYAVPSIENHPSQGASQAGEIKDGHLDKYVREIASSGGLPAISHQIQELMVISSNEKTSLSQFANVILKNVSLTAQLLRLVNTVYFSYQRTPIYSISHAIVILGWDTIRDTAASLMLLADFGKKSETVRDLLLLSVLTANSAMEVATRCKYPRKEEAYVCGMFSVLGELLVATYMPDEYPEILKIMTSSDDEQSTTSHRVIDFTFDQLGRAMLRHWGMPDRLAVGTQRLGSVTRQPQTEEQWLSLIATFSRELTKEVYRSGSGKENTPRLKSLLSMYGNLLDVTENNVNEVLARSYAQTEKAFSSARISLSKIRSVPAINIASTEMETQKDDEDVAEESGRVDKDSLRRFTTEVESVLHSDERLDVNDIVAMIMEAILRGAGFDRVLFCLTNRDRTQLHARLAVGQRAEELKQKFIFPVSFLEGPVGPAMLRKRDIFVQEISASHYSRSKFASIVGAQSLMMLPVEVNHRVIGCLYADRLTGVLVLDEVDKQLLLTLRDYLCDGIASQKQ